MRSAYILVNPQRLECDEAIMGGGGEPVIGRQEGIADATVLTDWEPLRQLGWSYIS